MAKPKNKRIITGGTKRSAEQREADLLICTKYFLRGYEYREIAVKLNKAIADRGDNYTITFQTIYRDLQKLLIEWKKESLDRIDVFVQKEIKKLDAIEVQLWEAWEASKLGRVTTQIKGIRPGTVEGRANLKEINAEENSRKEESSAGNPRFLQLLLEVMQRRAKLLGFDAPVKVDITDTSIREENTRELKYNPNDIPTEVIFKLADTLQAGAYERAVVHKESSVN